MGSITGDQNQLICTDCTADKLIEATNINQINKLKIFNFQSESFPTIQSTVSFLEIIYPLKGDIRLKSIPAFPNGIRKLDLFWANYTIGSFPDTLEWLEISFGNQAFVSSLPPFPRGLKILEIKASHLTTIPSLVDASGLILNQLTTVNFTGNKITKLPSLPTSVTTAIFTRNKIEVIDIPDRAIKINLDENPLIEPFRTIYEDTGYKPRIFKNFLEIAWSEMYRAQGKNVSALQQIIGKRRNNSLTRITPTGRLLETVPSTNAGAGAGTTAPTYFTNYTNIGKLIGSYLSGTENGVQHNKLASVNEQQQKLREKHSALSGKVQTTIQDLTPWAGVPKLKKLRALIKNTRKGGKRKTQKKRRARKTRKN